MRTRVLARAGVIAGTALLAAAGFAGLARAHAVTAMTMPVMGPGAVTRAMPAHMPGGMLMPVRAGSATLRWCACCCPGSDCACCTGGPTGAAAVRCCRGDDDSVMGAVALHAADHARVGCCPCACNCPCGACGGDALA